MDRARDDLDRKDALDLPDFFDARLPEWERDLLRRNLAAICAPARILRGFRPLRPLLRLVAEDARDEWDRREYFPREPALLTAVGAWLTLR